ncbi:hypothetical protein A1O1_01884 [Capronia coronata CBS 617.96]|uniref:Uncharacterized protein n=1 Tax=Capronia coronata CBS 617.96 TaxID=1182541 RepID=W9YKR5_9EURO|nr:uncharacterized protein A1O1_01884 [Capronia coronata CBS 617.96]EXJ93492.1 hypothetical protein A1O1_01884 [Capronia coronata CBS 617.96]
MATVFSAPDMLHFKADFLEAQSALVQDLANDIHKAASILAYKTYDFETEADNLRKRAWEIRSAETETETKNETEINVFGKGDQNNGTDFETPDLVTTAAETIKVAQQVKLELKTLIEVACGSGSSRGEIATTHPTGVTVDIHGQPKIKREEKEDNAAAGGDGDDAICNDVPSKSMIPDIANPPASVVTQSSLNARHHHRSSDFLSVNSQFRPQNPQIGLEKHGRQRANEHVHQKSSSHTTQTWSWTPMDTTKDECPDMVCGVSCPASKGSLPSSVAMAQTGTESPEMYACDPGEFELDSVFSFEPEPKPSTQLQEHSQLDLLADAPMDIEADEDADADWNMLSVASDHEYEAEVEAEHEHEHEHEHEDGRELELEPEGEFLPWIPAKIVIPRHKVQTAAERLLQSVLMGHQARLQRECAY